MCFVAFERLDELKPLQFVAKTTYFGHECPLLMKILVVFKEHAKPVKKPLRFFINIDNKVALLMRTLVRKCRKVKQALCLM